MSIRGDGVRFSVARRWAAQLLLLAFAARALIPTGYMPDFSAASQGLFKVVICSALGAKTIALDDSGKPLPVQDRTQDEPCAFAGFAAVALPALAAIDLAPPQFTAEHFAQTAVQLPPARAGPQLGSRGPPLLS